MSQVRLTPVAISLQALLNALGIKGGRGFDLSSAVVPVVDVSRLVEQESPLSDHKDQHFGSAGTGPHASTPRWTYTCPRRATVHSARASVLRAVAGGVVGTVQATISVTRAAGGTVSVLVRAQTNDNTVGAKDAQISAGHVELFPGDVLAADTLDLSTTTSINAFSVSAQIVEYQ